MEKANLSLSIILIISCLIFEPFKSENLLDFFTGYLHL